MRRAFAIFFALILTFPVFAIIDEEHCTRRIQAHLIVGDFIAASNEAQQALSFYPNSSSIHEGYIHSLAKLGKEKQLLDAWEIYHENFPDKSLSRELVEEMAWGVVCKASQSSSIIMREMALLAAFFCQDARGVAILDQGIQGSNYAIRALSVKFASHYRDQKLMEQIKRLFKQEKAWIVRKEVLAAIGKMKILSLQSDLEALIGSSESLSTEKALAINALLKMWKSPSRLHIEQLASSDRSGLRQLACQAIAHFQSIRDLDQLICLATDLHSDVRLEALQAIGLLKPCDQVDSILALARKGVKDMHSHVALSATWLLTLYMPEEGRKIFSTFLSDKRVEIRSLAAAVLSATGKYGITLSLDQLFLHNDPYVRLNLALGLIGQRQAVLESAECLKQMVLNEKSYWTTLEVGLFRAIVNQPTNNNQDALITPEIENQLLRLELLNVLAMVKAPGAQQVIRQYLMERSFEISGTAAISLLTEGDETAIDLIQELLNDPHPKVRLQAALILSLWSKEERAIQTLEEQYPHHKWELKIRILEGLGRIGSMRSIPFLVQVLKEPSQTLRLIAAVALIQCVNH